VTSSQSGYHLAAALADVPDGTMLSVQLETGERVCLYNFRGEIGAVSDTCPHQDFPICDGTLLGDGTIECAWHGARFDRVTGRVRRHPATEPLPVYEVAVRDGQVFVGPRKAR
jgi:3-phenylpropionate/trans-cinnamate dioxygenase ferredoxin component